MSQKEILNNCKNIESLIINLRIHSAIKKLRYISQELGRSDLLRKLDTLEETYNYLCQYLLNGMQDAGRKDMIEDISIKLQTIVDQITRDTLASDSPSYYYSNLRFNRLRDEHVSNLLDEYGKLASELSLSLAAENNDIELKKNSEVLLERLFNTLYASFYAENEYRDLKNYLLSGYADENISALAIGAITLGLVEFYDRAKLLFLIEIFENSESTPSIARAAVGFLIAMQLWSNRINKDSKIKARLSLWEDHDNFRFLKSAIRAIIGTRDTKLVADKMKEEVLPELMKLRPEIIKHLKEGNIDTVSGNLDDNPEWEEMLDKSGLSDKLRQLSDLQGDGADVLMLTFSNLKQFPFFNRASNWFLPFDINHSEISLDENSKYFINTLTSVGLGMCDSDMYSMALASNMMPEAQKQMISGQLDGYMEQIKEELKSRMEDSASTEFNTEVIKTVRDLYRFYKLFRKREGMNDPFEKPFEFISFPGIGESLIDNELLNLISEYYFKRGFYKDALPLLNVLTEFESDNSTLWEKKGFSHQSLGDYLNAKSSYEKAALLKQPGPWLTKKLGFINRKLGNFSEATEYYLKALEMDPENVNLIMNVGNSMLSEDNIMGAVQNFYHANYLSPDNPKILRALAWVELLNGNISKSRDFYSKIISHDARKSDYLNAGHVESLDGNFKDALNFYRLAAKDKKEEFETSFLADIEILEKLGADKTTMKIIFDLI